MPAISAQRRGVSLLELLVVVMLIGILSAVAAARFGRSLLAEFGAQGVARELSMALVACQRAAIRTGDDHLIEFLTSEGRISGYQIVRDATAGPVVIDGPKSISPDVTLKTSTTSLRYNFEGGAGGAYWVQVVGQQQCWRIDVVPINGAIRVSQT